MPSSCLGHVIVLELCRLPSASALPGLSRDMVMQQDGTVLNTCSTDALIEMLRFLKRAYWPFGWQTGNGPLAGGFVSAATVSMQQCASSDRTCPLSHEHRISR